MRIGVDATVLGRRRKTGVDYYTRGLLRAALPHLVDADIELCCLGRVEDDLGVSGPRVRRRAIPWMPPRLYRALMKRAVPPPFDLLARTHADVWLFPDFVHLPLWRRRPAVVVVYDLSFELYPQFVARGNRAYLCRWVRASMRRAAHVLTISASTRGEIAAHYGVPEDRISVAPPGVDVQFFRPRPEDETAAVRRRLGIPAPYVLFQGTLEPRKNVEGLVAAFGLLPDTTRRNLALVLAGRPGWLDTGIQTCIARARRAGCTIVTPGYVPEAELPALYSGAQLFVCPSHYEGFGMPVLEAMACGAAVVISDTAALREVAGDVALRIDPHRPDAIAAAMAALLDDAAQRRARGRSGRERALGFGWEASGCMLAAILRRLGHRVAT